MSETIKIDIIKISMLYWYFIVEEDLEKFNELIIFHNKSCDSDNHLINQKRSEWIYDFLKVKNEIISKIEERIIEQWSFENIEILEKSLFCFSIFEMIYLREKKYANLIIYNSVSFSKKYLGENKYKYVNKILDLIKKEKI